MNLKYLKLGTAVLGIAVLTYIFFPTAAQQGQRVAQSRGQEKAKTVYANKAKPVKHKTVTAKSTSKRITQARIEPETTLRKSTRHSHSGPPSKMYGGL
jgi:hypothetical protein